MLIVNIALYEFLWTPFLAFFFYPGKVVRGLEPMETFSLLQISVKRNREKLTFSRRKNQDIYCLP